MKSKYLLLFFCLHVHAAMREGVLDPSTTSVVAEVDKHMIIDDRGNAKKTAEIHSTINNNSDANRFISQFEQAGKEAEVLSHKIEKQVNH